MASRPKVVPMKEPPEKRQPDFVIRAKVREETKDGSRMRWMTIGAMWSAACESASAKKLLSALRTLAFFRTPAARSRVRLGRNRK